MKITNMVATGIAALILSGVATAAGLTPPQQLSYDVYKELVEIDTTTATGDTARRPRRWPRG
ncbi:hypothetical protein [Bradyrhizobium liaoningense]|uniref:hypothetical protein n=1 Tax=Bradyrhizobium liaoningense TaxID=43992 RepID=UPI001BA63FBE|nr:hypothetical protein [Bradyrhizobium liaoningense]MBR0713478.1 hypothetical protein [Bradyrhizobium liaoningense]